MIKNLLSLVEAGEDVALVTIIHTLGSTPRNAGAKMLVLPDGRIYGSIGGGCGESEVKREALGVLHDAKVSKKFRLELTNDVAAGDGMVCGGVFEVFIDFISHKDDYVRQVLSEYLASIQRNENPILITITSMDSANKDISGRKMVCVPGKKAVGNLVTAEISKHASDLIELVRKERKLQLKTISARGSNNVQLLFEPSFIMPHLLVFGGGHISKPLISMASILGYHTTVIDDRPDFANKVRFPEAAQVICQDFDSFMKKAEINTNTFVVIITRGHQHDLECLREMVGKPAAYIGMIGSHRKVKAVLKQLESEGVSADELKEVYTPIGIKIGAETPEEIALCILAEIVSVWRGENISSRV